MSLLPKLSKDQSQVQLQYLQMLQRSMQKSLMSVTVAPDECDVAVVPNAPQSNQIKFRYCHYLCKCSSVPINTVPEDGKDDELAIDKLVTLVFNDDNVEVNCPPCCPPHGPRDQPVDAVPTAGPTE